MKGHMIILDHLAGLEVAAQLVDGRLEDLLVDPQDGPRPGAIFRAICDRPLKGQGGMILRLPEGKAGFLRQSKGLAPGQPILCQVTGFADAGKATPVTDKILFKSRYAIVTPGRPGLNVSRQIKDEDTRERILACAHEAGLSEGFGLILRSSCESAQDADIIDDIIAMDDLAAAICAEGTGPAEALTEGDSPHTLAWRDWTAPAHIVTKPGGLEQHGIIETIESLNSPRIGLDGNAHAFIEPTRALVAVDVNTGGDTSPAAALKANLALSKALPRALRLRGLGGQIVIDFAPSSKAHRKQIESALRSAFRSDPIDTALVGWTPLGHFELQRKRERSPVPFQSLIR